MQYLNEAVNVNGKLVLVRSGLNVPIDDGHIIDDFRIIRAVPTLSWLMEHGAKVVVIGHIEHIGRDGSNSLKGVADAMNKKIPTQFVANITLAREQAKEGMVTVVENLRVDPREIMNDDTFARELSEGFDLFVQDAFEVCHRKHTSVVGIPKYIKSFGGLLLKEEVDALTKALKPEKPALFVLGGGKVETKEPLLQKMLPIYDAVFIGGVLQNEILSAHGMEIGKSKAGDNAVPFSILTTDKSQDITDVIVERSDGSTQNVSTTRVLPTDVIVDMGRDTIKTLTASLAQYKTIVWNGPMGWYERGFDDATIHLAHALIQTQAITIVGGGDTVAVLQKEGLTSSFTFVSTGGGAMLQFLQDGSLPGIDALK